MTVYYVIANNNTCNIFWFLVWLFLIFNFIEYKGKLCIFFTRKLGEPFWSCIADCMPDQNINKKKMFKFAILFKEKWILVKCSSVNTYILCTFQNTNKKNFNREHKKENRKLSRHVVTIYLNVELIILYVKLRLIYLR